MTRLRLFSFALLFACWTGCTNSGPSETNEADRDSTNVPTQSDESDAAEVELQVLDFEGIEQLVKSHQGRVVVMDAWSTSCPPCVKEFPHLVKLHHEYGPEKVACISLSFDYEGIDIEEAKARALKFLRQQKATFDNVISSEESDVLYKKFELAAVPAIFVYDREGKLVKRFEGEPEEGELYDGVRTLVEILLEDSPAEGK